MPSDASIYGQIQQPRQSNRLADLAQAMQVQGLQSQNALAQYTMKKAEREDADVTAMNSAYSQSVGPDGKIDRNKLYQLAAQSNLGAKLPGLQKGFADSDTAQVKADAEKFKLATDRHDYFKKTLGALAQEPGLTKEMVVQAGQGLVQQGILPAEMYQQSIASMPDDINQLRARLVQGVKAQMTPEQIFTVFAPKAEKIDNGGQISFRDMNPNSPTYGQNTGGGAVAKVQSPDNIASVGASLANASATREVAKATRDAAQITGNQNTEMKLGDDYRAQSKNFKETADAYKQISAVLDKATTSPAATLAGATKFMKMIDPGSVVRESELGMALAATGVFDRATNYFNTLANGRVLTPSQVKDFKAITKQINDAASSQQRLIDQHFSGVAKQYGLRPEMVVQDYGQNGGPATPAAPAGIDPAAIAAELARRGGK